VTFNNYGGVDLASGQLAVDFEFHNYGIIRVRAGNIVGDGTFLHFDEAEFLLEMNDPGATCTIDMSFGVSLNATVLATSGHLHCEHGPGLGGILSSGIWIAVTGTTIRFQDTVSTISGGAALFGSSSSYPNVQLATLDAAKLVTSDWVVIGNLLVDNSNLEVRGGGSGMVVNGTLTNREGGKVSVEQGAELETDQMDNGDGIDSVIPELIGIGAVPKGRTEPPKVITPLLNNHGRILPGDADGVGTLHLVGNLVQHPTGGLDIDLNGAVPDTLHDQLTIDGDAFLDGTVVVGLQPDFTPTEGEEFTILTVTGTITGEFAGVDPPPGVTFSLRHESDHVVLVTEEVGSTPVPEVGVSVGLAAVYPNPFNPQTTITFTLDQPQHVEVAVYDLTGKLLGVLASRSYDAGNHSTDWNGKDSMGRAVPSGTYVVRLNTESAAQAKKMMLVR
jgi:hypothetical protein